MAFYLLLCALLILFFPFERNFFQSIGGKAHYPIYSYDKLQFYVWNIKSHLGSLVRLRLNFKLLSDSPNQRIRNLMSQFTRPILIARHLIPYHLNVQLEISNGIHRADSTSRVTFLYAAIGTVAWPRFESSHFMSLKIKGGIFRIFG